MSKIQLKSENDLTKAFEKELFDNSLDMLSDYSEIAIDSFIEDEILSEIPIVKSILSFYRITTSIKDRHNMKKLILFFNQFHSNSIDKKKLNVFKQRLNSDEKYKNDVIELTLVLIEKFIDAKKSKVLANLLSAHIESKITWNDYRKLVFALNALNPIAFPFFIKHNLVRLKDYTRVDFKIKMLEMVEYEPMLVSCGIGFSHDYRFQLNGAGKKLYDFGFSTLIEEFLVT